MKAFSYLSNFFQNRELKSHFQRQSTLIIQPLPGIGDMVWHLPHLHAIAKISPVGKVSILTKPRSRADRLLGADPFVDNILWIERRPGHHDGLLGFFRLVALLRRYHFKQVWILHDSARYTWTALLAGIPERIGYGVGLQKYLLSSPISLPKAHLHDHPIIKADLLLKLCSISNIEDEPHLWLAQKTKQKVAEKFAHIPTPWIALGIGSSESFKQWGKENFLELACKLYGNMKSSLLLVGGAAELAMANWIMEEAWKRGVKVWDGMNLSIDQTAALLSLCKLYIGNDTGFLNMTAALSINAIGLFGSSPPLRHSRFIHVLLPDDGKICDYGSNNMQGISINAVLNQVSRVIDAAGNNPYLPNKSIGNNDETKYTYICR